MKVRQGAVVAEGKAERRSSEAAAGRRGLIPDCGMPYLEPLERCAERNPALKVLTRHKNGANTPRKPIINEL